MARVRARKSATRSSVGVEQILAHRDADSSVVVAALIDTGPAGR
jgi:hypothetical protein